MGILLEQQLEYNIDSESYKNFISSIDSPITKRCYRYWLAYFMKFLHCTDYDALSKIEPRKIEGFIRDYIVYMREDKKFAPATISGRIAAISHFLEMNDVHINRKKIKKYKGKHRSKVEDRPYQREEIKKLIELAPLRDKAIICLLASSGMRRGALPRLRLRDIERIDKYNLYKFTVYKNESESYITYCTPECTKLIDEYIQYRSSLGEKLNPNTPLFRQIFDSVLQINRPLPIGEYAISRMISRLLKDSSLTKSYFKPTDQELLEGNDKALGYVAAINDLTINEEYRLHKKIDELVKNKDEIELREIKHREELKSMREEMESRFQQILTKIDLTKIK